MPIVNNTAQVLVIDDEQVVQDSLIQTLELEGFLVKGFKDPESAIALCSGQWPGVVVCDVRMPVMNGIDVLKKILEIDVEIPVIMLSAHSDIEPAIQAIRIGAYDFLEKTDDPQRHIDTVKRAWRERKLVLENRRLRSVVASNHDIDYRLIGEAPSMRQLKQAILHLARVDVDLIINGETGTGKEVIARCLHNFSARSQKPFVAINCGALNESIIESELFGHEVGAFTGANKKRIGKIEYADGGVLFLDEIESMPTSLQVRLLRVLQERSLQRVGGNVDIHVDIRVLAATKVNLLDICQQGGFREDLYYRLNVASIDVPPLDQRKEDIPLLFKHFVNLAGQRLGMTSPPLSNAVLNQLDHRAWPGNVRELRNTAERWLLGLRPFNEPYGSTNDATVSTTLDAMVDGFECETIIAALKKNHGHAQKTAKLLGIPRKKLYLRMKKYNIDLQHYTEH